MVKIRKQPADRAELNRGRHLVVASLEKAKPFSRVLDIGAGTGKELAAAKTICPDAELHAIEVYEAYAEILRNEGVTVSAASIERQSWPYEDESFDIVIANHILEHLKDIYWVMHEAARTLRPGGHLIIGVPNLASLHNRILLALGRQPTSIRSSGPHVRGFTRRDMTEFVTQLFPGGFQLESFGGSNFYPLPTPVAKTMARWLPSMAVSMGFSFRKLKPYQDEYLTYLEEARLETDFFAGAD